MTHTTSPIRRGMTLLELMLALVITAMIAGAISGMMDAVSIGVSTRRDSRATMVGASAAASRLSAYIAPSRCLLSAGGSDLALWLDDSRESDTIHATEIRWLLFDSGAGEISVHFVSFPSEWSQAAKDLEDNEYASDSNWNSVLAYYQSRGWTVAMPLVDGLDSISISTDKPGALDSRHVIFNLGFQTGEGTFDVTASATISIHHQPSI